MKSSLIQTNFTGGEMSPKLYGRVDIAKYNNCAKELRNVVPLIFGGAESRDGTVFVASTKDSTKRSRLIPFSFSSSQSYVLEFGDLYMRVFTAGGQVETSPGVPYEVETEISADMLPALNFAQSADTMILAHELLHPQKVTRLGHAAWVVDYLNLTCPPLTDDHRIYPDADLNGLMIGGHGSYNVTASDDVFHAGDYTRYIHAAGGVASINTVVSGNTAGVNVVTPFAASSATAGNWYISGGLSEATIYSPSGDYLMEGDDVSISFGIASLRPGDEGVYITSVKNRTNDLGDLVVRLDFISSATVATGKVVSAFNAKKVSNQWKPSVIEVRDGIFSEGRFPSAVAFKDQRLYLGGGVQNPSRLWASEIGDIYNFGWSNSFTPQTSTSSTGDSVLQDTSSLDFKIAESQEPIAHLITTKGLMALTFSGVFSIEGGVERPVTPTNVQIKNQSDIGANIVRPVRVQDEMYFVNRAGGKLFSCAYSIESDGFRSSDVSKMADHIASIGIVEIAYQREPNSILYVVLADGTMATLTIDREENVIAWSRHVTDGEVESVVAVPEKGNDQVWMIVRRDINGSSVRQVERFEPTVTMDSAIIGTQPGGADVWAGLDHLEGKQVQVVGDGQYMGTFTVHGGEVELPRAVESVIIGLGFQQRIVMLPPEAPTQNGTSQGKNLSLGPVRANFLNTLGAKIYIGDRIQNAEPVGLRALDVDQFDTPVEPFTGWHKLDALGVSTVLEPEQTQVTIIQEYPLKMHVRAVAREVTVND